MLFYDFINLTQVHNFTVNAQDIFTFGRLPLFTVSFTGNADNEKFCIRTEHIILLTSQVVMVQSLQPKGCEFESKGVSHFFYFTFN